MLENVPCFTMDSFGIIQLWYDFEGEVIAQIRFKNTFAFENRGLSVKRTVLERYTGRANLE